MNEAQQTAALWLAATSEADKPRPLIPYLKAKFDLTALQAIEAINQARQIMRSHD